MVAGAVPVDDGGDGFEVGCGAGAASLCLAARVPTCKVIGIDVQPQLVDLALSNAVANNLKARMSFVTADVFALPPELKRDFDHVFCNPPFHDAAGRISPVASRAMSLVDEGRLGEWLATGLKRVRSQGTLTVILRADKLGEALRHLPESGIVIFPLWPRRDVAAKRVILQVRKDSGVPAVLLSGLVVHESDGSFTPPADAVLRGARLSLALGSRPL